MRDFKANLKYYRLGEFVACVMLKGIIHPDMKEDNLGTRYDGSIVLSDFAEVEKVILPDELSEHTVRKFTEAIFPPMDNILKSFEFVSSFRAGFVSVGGLLGQSIFANASNNGLSSFLYLSHAPDSHKYDPSIVYVDSAAIKEIEGWKRLVMHRLLNDTNGMLDIEAIQVAVNNVDKRYSYQLDNLLLLKAYAEKENADKEFAFWITALHTACNSIKHGMIYTGYGILRKVLHMCEHAYPQIVIYHAKIEELLEGRKLSDNIKQFIEECMEYNFFEVIWILNDIDMLVE